MYWMRFYLSLVIALLVALQSVVAIAEVNNSHLSAHSEQSVHSSEDHVSEHHANSEVLSQDHDHDEHPDCHQNHCHHSNLIFIELSPLVLFCHHVHKQLSSKQITFASLALSPGFRPPIV